MKFYGCDIENTGNQNKNKQMVLHQNHKISAELSE
jgi:hypothetical protein